MFEDFEVRAIDVADGVRLRVRVGGNGPPVVLLHGHPRTHTTWYLVAPLLVTAGHTVVCPDLRGYGRSSAPRPLPDHAQASKRAMARDVLDLMGQLGHHRFAVVGHDRGSYAAFRLAMDHPEAITHLAVLDSVPIAEALARADARFAVAWWHWFLYAQPETPERVISADPDAWYATGPDQAARMGEANYADYLTAIHDPPWSARWSRTTARAWESTGTLTKPIVTPDDACSARHWWPGPRATTWRSSTATSWPSGGLGPCTFEGSPSPADTTWPRTRPKTLPLP